ncbi:uncharacterized protein [Elaeis guineensis]|uniref:Uncharacterized protein LOC105050032 isoform X2 n=1 Tax=Elaeis guineensis var. tenera TaxID=51953 RepID=A0A6I9RKP6_ELAGV|nr:uncharacterized protein LOC105050032 isoform X2 [Elaeis guineensis]
MLSTENTSDPSCSSKLPVLKADERASEKLALQEADPVDLCERPTPNFSIRDYVFTSRSKGIETNWPFPEQLLQLCLKHGVSDLLPPFEPPDLVRAQCVRKQVEPEQPGACLEAELRYCADTVGTASIKGQSCSLLHDLVVECSDRAQYTPRDKGKHTVDQEVALDEHVHRDAEISLAVRSPDQTGRFSGQISELPCSVSVNKSFSEASSEVEVAGPAPSEKKCRLIVKFGAISVTSRAEDIVSNSSTVSDPMASKICPVCKTFSSTSNTTLNAHMDQCLSVESKTNQLLTNFSTPKVKPKKKRLMVDIYKTAPRCTLEDLDRRNGTNWALVTLTNENPTEMKRLKLLPMDARDEGAVYVDSHGIKLRILSKFNDAPPVMSREDSHLRKHAKDIKASKCMLISKKKRFASKCSDNMKVKAHKKKLSSFKLLKAQAKGESNACDQVNTSGSATLRPWVCSKRSDLPKKLNNRNDYKNLKNAVAITRDALAENGQRDSDNSTAMRSHILKISRPSEDLTAAPRTKKVNPQSNMVHTMEYGKKMTPKQPISKLSSENPSLASGLLLKLSRSSGTFTSSPRSKREEVHMGSRQKSDNSSDMTTKVSENCQTLVRDQACSTLEKNVLVVRPSFSLEASKGDLNGKPTTFKRFRKSRSILRTGKREVRSLVRGLYASIRDFGPDGTGANETPRSHHFGPSEHVPMSEMGEIMDQVPSSTIVIPDSVREREAPSTMEVLPLEAECQDPGNETRDMQVEVSSSFSGDHATEPSMKEVTGDAVTSGTTISYNLTPASNARFDLQRSVIERVQSISTSEHHVQVAQRSLDKQEMDCGDVLRDQDNRIADDVGLEGLKDSCASQYRECQVDTASIQESSACLTSHGDLGPEVHQENSSATSVRVTSNHLANDGEPAESPESTASNVSLPSPKDSRSKDTESEILLRDTSAQDTLGSAVPSTENSGGTEGRIAERINRESKVILPESKAEQFPKDQPFCCSCRESLSKESQLVKNVVTAGTTLPSKGKQISSLYIGPRMSSSFHPYQSPRANGAATSCLESPTQSNATKISMDSPTNIPACSDFGSPSPSSQSKTQSNANPRLRLMGKDLMVVKKEEPVQPPTSFSDYLTNARCLSPLGFASTNFVVNHENFQCYHQLLDGGSVLGRPPSMVSHQMLHYSPGLQVGGFAGAPTQNGLMDHHVQQKNSCKNLISPAVCSVGRTDPPHHQREKPSSSTRAPYTMQEVILIDDGPETEAKRRGSLVTPAGSLPPPTLGPDAMLQRQCSYFPSQNQFISRDVAGGPRPSFTNLYPRVNADFMKGEYFSQGLGPVLPSPFVFQSPTPGQLSSLYYSHTHR